MKLTVKFLTLFTIVTAFLTIANAQNNIYDDFSAKDWHRYRSTPGSLLIEKNKLTIEDHAGKNSWVTVSKSFEVDITQTPIIVVRIDKLNGRGVVKLVRRNPYIKKTVISTRHPGIYTVNLKEKYNWSGVHKIEVALYTINDGSSITYNYVKFTDKLTAKEKAEIAKVKNPRAQISPRPPFELVPMFNTCSYYYNSPKLNNVDVFWRTANGKWEKALAPVWISEELMYRGSIVNLQENTKYDFKIVTDSKVLKTASFKTWSSKVPIGKTIVLNEKNFKGSLVITEQGTPQNWIKYTSAPGFVLTNNNKTPLIKLLKAKYIILEGLTLNGGSSKAIIIEKSQDVRVINCDISGWGRLGEQRFDKDGKFYNENGKAINYDSGIYLVKSKNTVIERCYFHDPRNTANSWHYSHPAGPSGMLINRPESTVVRYNDFIGSDSHRWNDAIEGAGNFHKDGGFNRDADIYGNIMTMANDDCIEIDGGQQNVRVFLNKFENALCGVSIQGCMAGPSYVFKNLLINMGDIFGRSGQIIKTSSPCAGKDAVSFIFNNTINVDNHNNLPLHKLFKIVAKNNIFAGKGIITGRAKCKKAVTDYNLVSTERERHEKHGLFGIQPKFQNTQAGLFKPEKSCSTVGNGIEIPNFTPYGRVDLGAFQQCENLVLPYRPIPVTLDKYQLNYTVRKGKASPAQTVTAQIGGKNFSSSYKIRKNQAFDWFTVAPTSGNMSSGQKIKYTITLKPELMDKRKIYRGVFLMRLANGFSRPVSIYAKTDKKNMLKPTAKGAFTLFIEAEHPASKNGYKTFKDSKASGGKYIYVATRSKQKEPVLYNLNIPKDGTYYLQMRVKSEIPVSRHNSIFYSVNGEKMQAANMISDKNWIWAPAANNDKSMMRLKAFKLKKGINTLRIMPRESVYLDMIAVTDNPKIFEPH